MIILKKIVDEQNNDIVELNDSIISNVEDADSNTETTIENNGDQVIDTTNDEGITEELNIEIGDNEGIGGL